MSFTLMGAVVGVVGGKLLDIAIVMLRDRRRTGYRRRYTTEMSPDPPFTDIGALPKGIIGAVAGAIAALVIHTRMLKDREEKAARKKRRQESRK